MSNRDLVALNGNSESTITIKKSYPPPQATYEEVVADPKLFMGTLEVLHRTMGTKFMIPTIGGKALDLHRLFVEVTSRGGLEKVIRDRRWKDVIAAFSFPPTITSASFALRKYYISLLHHYEQIYLFRHQDWPVSATAGNPADAPASVKPQTGTPITQEKETNKHQLPAGHLVTGVIDGKFEHGYLVTVNVGSTKLRGVLYHVPQETHVAHNSASSEDLPSSRRSLRKGLRDPSHPKSNRSGYNFFFAEHYARLKPLYCGEEKAISKEIGQLWNNLTKSEKEFYEEKAMRDKERYRTEMLEYKKARSSSKYQ